MRQVAFPPTNACRQNSRYTGRRINTLCSTSFRHDGLLAAIAAKAPLILEFVKHVFRIGLLLMEDRNSPGLGLVWAQIGDMDRHFVLGRAPELVLRAWPDRLESAHDDDSPGPTPSTQLHGRFCNLLAARRAVARLIARLHFDFLEFPPFAEFRLHVFIGFLIIGEAEVFAIPQEFFIGEAPTDGSKQ